MDSDTPRHREHPDMASSANSLASSDDAEQDINILILGDSGTGKTCLNSRYVLRQFVNTGDAAQLTGGHKFVTVDPPAPSSVSATSTSSTSSTQVHLIVQDFPCGPWQATIDNCVPDGNVPLTGDYIYATLQSDFRQSLLTRADAVMLVCNPWSRSSFEWIDGVKSAGSDSDSPVDGGDGGIVNEVLEAARRKHLSRRVGLLLDALNESTSAYHREEEDARENKNTIKNTEKTNKNKNKNTLRRSPTALGRPAPRLDVALPGDERRARHAHKNRSAPAPSAPYDFELEYPVLVVGAASDRLVENGGDLARQVRRADGDALARRFRLRGADDVKDDDDPDAYTSRYMELSARTDENVDDAFQWLIRRVLAQKACARERKRRQDAVAAVRRRVAEETRRRYMDHSVGIWAASMVWAVHGAVASAVHDCLGAGRAVPGPAARPRIPTAPAVPAMPAMPATVPDMAPVTVPETVQTVQTVPYTAAANPPMTMDQPTAAASPSTLAADPSVDYIASPSPITSRASTPVSRQSVARLDMDDYTLGLGFSRTTTRTDSDTASLPSLITDTMSLSDVAIPDGYLFRRESLPSTPVAVEALPRLDGVGKAGRTDVELGEQDWRMVM